MQQIIDALFGAGLFLNALLFLPQAICLLKEKNSNEISLTTFIGFTLLNVLSVFYGFYHAAFILAWGSIAASLTCGAATLLALYYRIKPLNTNPAQNHAS